MCIRIGQLRSSRLNWPASLVPASIWKRTAQCAEVTLPESREACARVLALRQELAAAQAATALEERIAEARRQLATMPVVTATADPQVQGLATLLGMDERSTAGAPWRCCSPLWSSLDRHAVLLWQVPPLRPEPYTLHHHRTQHHHPANATCINPAPSAAPGPCAPSKVVELRPSGKRRPGRAATTSDPSVLRWVQQCVRRDQRGAVGARSAYQSYCGWAADTGVAAATETAFGRHMSAAISAMGGRKARRGQGAFYVGIRIVQVPTPQPVRMAA